MFFWRNPTLLLWICQNNVVSSFEFFKNGVFIEEWKRLLVPIDELGQDTSYHPLNCFPRGRMPDICYSFVMQRILKHYSSLADLAAPGESTFSPISWALRIRARWQKGPRGDRYLHCPFFSNTQVMTSINIDALPLVLSVVDMSVFLLPL